MAAAPGKTSLLCAALALFAWTAHAKTIVCIEPGENDGYLASAEGYYRSLYPVPPNVVSTTGTLQDCLAGAVKGDKIIIVSHGKAGGAFYWGETPYGGFGGGTGAPDAPHPLPPGFSTLNNISIKLVQCWSALDPDGNDPKKSVVKSLTDALTGPGVIVTGFTGRVNSGSGVRVSGGSKAQRDAAEKYLTETNDSWMDNPPPNRPDAVNNQQTAAQQLLDAQFPGKNLTVTVIFREPFDEGPEQQPIVAWTPAVEGAEHVGDACGDRVAFISGEAPFLSGAASAALGLILLASGWGVVRRRARA